MPTMELQLLEESNRTQSRNNNEEGLLGYIKKPQNKKSIDLARRVEKRIRLHTVGTQDSTTSFDDWLENYRSVLPTSKFNVFKSLIGDPVPTLTLSEQIFDELAKVFEAVNSSQKLTFETDNSKYTNELHNYFNLDKFFRTEVFNRVKVAPNSFIIVDAEEELVDNKTAPYPYFVDIENIVDVDVSRDGSTNYILFHRSQKEIVGIDKKAYYVYEKIDSSDWTLKSGYPKAHNLTDPLGRPYTPAFMMYPNFLNASDNIVVNSPLTKALGNLEWLLFWAVSKRYLDLYAPFPIYVSFEEDCTFEAGGLRCNEGFLVGTNEDMEEVQTKTPCPKCSKDKLFGAGTEITVPAPQSKEEPNLLDAINVIPAEKESIKYVTEEKIRLEQEVYYSVLGKTSQPLETFSQSISQLDLSTESRKAVLLHMKEILESVHQKVLYTMAKLRYGDTFKDCYVNYGDNYFLTTAEQETKNYQALKNAGAPEGMLHSNLERVISTTYRTSPSTELLNQIYLEVEPYQTMSVEAVSSLLTANLVTRKKALSKVHFTDFIEEFESEHEALVSTVELGEYSKSKIVRIIKDQLNKYIESVITDIDGDLERLDDRQEEQIKREGNPLIAKPASINKRKYREEED